MTINEMKIQAIKEIAAKAVDTTVEKGLDTKAMTYRMMEEVIVEMIVTDMTASEAVDKMTHNGLDTTAMNYKMIEEVISEI